MRRQRIHVIMGSTLLLMSSAFAPARATARSLIEFQAPKESHHHESQAQQLVKETRETAGEDKTQFTHSSAVQWIADHTGLSVEQASVGSMFLNFAVIAGAIFWLSKKNLPAFFRNRTAAIQKAMEEARKASEDANRRLADIEARLSRIDSEIGAMRTAAEKEAAQEEQRIKAAAEEDARRLIESVGQEIDAMAKNTRRELTAYVANLAVSLAKKQIQVDAATDQALVHGVGHQLSNGGDGRKQ